jgi:hypothetical protein
MQMVFAPVRLRRSPDIEELASSLAADINLVLTEAARRQQIRERDSALPGLAPEQFELSSHAVMEAVATTWNNLRLSSFRIWGED